MKYINLELTADSLFPETRKNSFYEDILPGESVEPHGVYLGDEECVERKIDKGDEPLKLALINNDKNQLK